MNCVKKSVPAVLTLQGRRHRDATRALPLGLLCRLALPSHEVERPLNVGGGRLAPPEKGLILACSSIHQDLQLGLHSIQSTRRDSLPTLVLPDAAEDRQAAVLHLEAHQLSRPTVMHRHPLLRGQGGLVRPVAERHQLAVREVAQVGDRREQAPPAVGRQSGLLVDASPGRSPARSPGTPGC